MPLLLTVYLSTTLAAAFETQRAVVHSGDGFCGRAALSVQGGQVTVACAQTVTTRHRFAVRRAARHSRLLALDVPMVVAVPGRDRAAFDAALRENGISIVD